VVVFETGQCSSQCPAAMRSHLQRPSPPILSAHLFVLIPKLGGVRDDAAPPPLLRVALLLVSVVVRWIEVVALLLL